MGYVLETESTATGPTGDPDRPGYHFLPAPSWINDPKPIFHSGAYHVYFQYCPGIPYSGAKHWGHAVSRDLVHWEELPIALSPSDGPDGAGCWTGCVVHDPVSDTFACLYTAVSDLSRADLGQTQCLAVSTDLVHWRKHADNPVISAAQKPAGFGNTFRDPCVWQEGTDWFCVIGGNRPEGDDEFYEGVTFLYRSADLVSWEYLHPLYAGTAARDECPDFFPLDGPNGRKWVLLSSRGRTAWAIGTYKSHRFVPESTGTVDDGLYYAAKTLVDDRGRRILFGWIQEDRLEADFVAAGWSGVIALPRVLELRADGSLGFQPAPELSALRRGRRSVTSLPASIAPGESISVPTGDRAEVRLRFGPGAADGVELGFGAVTIAYDQAASTLGGRPLRLADDEPLEVVAYVDHSVIEVFAHGQVGKTLRTYGADRAGELTVTATGDVIGLDGVDVYDLGPDH